VGSKADRERPPIPTFLSRQAAPDAPPREDPPTPADQTTLVSFFAAQAQTLCGSLGMPAKTAATALYFLHRFFARSSALEHDPKDVMLTCVYVAAKAEESYISADRLAGAAGAAAATLLRREPGLLQGIGFDLLIWLPHRALEGHWVLLRDAGAGGAPEALAADVAAASPAALDAAQAASHRALAVLLRTDGPLTHTPGQLALAALRSGARKEGLQASLASAYAAHAATLAVANASGHASKDAAAVEAELRAAIASLDAAAAAAADPPSADAARLADARLRRARAPLVDRAKAAAAERDAGAPDARARKAAAKRAAAAAREAELLGPAPPLLPRPDGDGGGGKRRKSEAGPGGG